MMCVDQNCSHRKSVSLFYDYRTLVLAPSFNMKLNETRKTIKRFQCSFEFFKRKWSVEKPIDIFIDILPPLTINQFVIIENVFNVFFLFCLFLSRLIVISFHLVCLLSVIIYLSNYIEFAFFFCQNKSNTSSYRKITTKTHSQINNLFRFNKQQHLL